MDLYGYIPSRASNFLTSDTTFLNYLLIVDAYFKIPNIYSIEKITTEEVMDKLVMFESRFGKIDEFEWWDLKRISANVSTQVTSTEFKEKMRNMRNSFDVSST